METSDRRFNLIQQVALCSAIFLVAFGVHKALAWRETSVLPVPVTRQIPLSGEDKNLARNAWRYFELNRSQTGLVTSAAGFPATTMWDVANQLAGMVAARELGLISPQEFDPWMTQVLTTLKELPLYRNELPNKAYNATTLVPIDYGQPEKRQEVGFSAVDLGRLARWLDIVAVRYPQHAAASQAVTSRWKLDRLVNDGQIMAATTASGKEVWQPEGTLGYEQYAAYGLSKLGLKPTQALDVKTQTQLVDVMNVEVTTDQQGAQPNCVVSEPYVLDGLESGFKALPVEYAARLLQAQQHRYLATNQLTAWSETNLDQAPWQVHNCVVANSRPWQTVTPGGEDAAAFRGSSTKIAIAWNVLFRNRYTERTYKGMRWLADPQQGVFAGFYEESQQPNRALTLNTNAIVLEALLYNQTSQPLEVWATSSEPSSASFNSPRLTEE
ncbi:DUF3131 domain-containing protein [Trichocoleus sp. FACHB-591]|uniref:DUF3131 domain-containing protein n=1 Tax=Trichocoleus sp. FACHB-591 TaxID=2692872 RepID=UPI00168294F7|nr:DUF3131 domain-containing protein [Trichocoleus sp. FACHB-591]MBD2098005.1 DUF3131 domain-containing protein [Trichocoleus sp. FACHB-591]